MYLHAGILACRRLVGKSEQSSGGPFFSFSILGTPGTLEEAKLPALGF
jgi:hypothetical protein